MPPDLALLSTLTGSNYPCLELILKVHKGVRAIEVRLYVSFHGAGEGCNLLSEILFFIPISVLVWIANATKILK